MELLVLKDWGKGESITIELGLMEWKVLREGERESII